MTYHPKTLVVDIWSDMACVCCLQAKNHFDEALAVFPGKDRVRVNLHMTHRAPRPAEKALTCELGPADVNAESLSHADGTVSVISDGVPLFVFNRRFYVSGTQSVQRYANALEGMLILSGEETGVPAAPACALDRCLV